MLKTLHIENIAVIERADVEFNHGLSVLTGETGAGKSVMIDALNAVLGSRTSRELVRSGAEKASVTAVFDARSALDWCRDNDIDTEEDEIILQRRITADGRSSGRVNGVPVSQSQLRELGNLLLDIHGQNDGRQLLDERRHRDYLDRYGVDEKLLADYAAAYVFYRDLLRQAESFRMDEEEKARREETLRHRIEELEKAELRPGEETELSERRDLLRNAEKLTEGLDAAFAALYDIPDSAVSLCGDAEEAVRRASAWSSDLKETAQLIRDARLSLEDAAERLREKRASLDFSPEEYDRLEERLALLRRLERRYSAADGNALIALLEESRQAMEELSYAGDRLQKLEREAAEAEKKARAAAQALSLGRQTAGERLEAQVERELRELNMPSVRFRVFVEPRAGQALDATGMDEVRFLMSANIGEALGPISRIASGGELSRIMLALKNVFAEKDAVDALIFDEIDTGVSGVAAQRVAEKLAKLAKNKQVLCVTHLPQIAAMAEFQYLVEKQERDGRTYTSIRLLDRAGRRREIARINGGEDISPTMLSGAEEMLQNADAFRASLK
ncbi:MAG: DNA repair protein RecN [Oscillospiraceae bacterium]|nr:DNA repair protein RecN [Oscillospiraceae bacterium]